MESSLAHLQYMDGAHSDLKPVQKRTRAACVHCQNAKVACSAMRPCVWCIRHGTQDTCVDAPKKERKQHKRKRQTDDQAPNSHVLSVLPTQPTYFLPPMIDNNIYAVPPATITLLEDNTEEVSIEALLDSMTPSTNTGIPSPPATVPSMITPSPSYTIISPTPVQDYSGLIQSEVKRAQISMENVALLSQIQQQQSTLPFIVSRLPDLRIIESNENFAKLVEYSTLQEFLGAGLTMLDLILPQLRPFIQKRAHKFYHKPIPKIVRTGLLHTKYASIVCCTLVLMPTGESLRIYILRHSPGMPERAARKLECISVLSKSKNLNNGSSSSTNRISECSEEAPPVAFQKFCTYDYHELVRE